jgi:hypothetical protein
MTQDTLYWLLLANFCILLLALIIIILSNRLLRSVIGTLDLAHRYSVMQLDRLDQLNLDLCALRIELEMKSTVAGRVNASPRSNLKKDIPDAER